MNLDSVEDQDLAKDDMIGIRHKELLKSQFYSKELGEFWCSML